MSVRIKVSYTTDKELAGVLRLLFPAIKSWKVSGTQKGKHKNAYVELKNGKV